MGLFEELKNSSDDSVVATVKGDYDAEFATTYACGEEGGSPC